MLSSRAAVLITLRQGPGYGRQLIERVRSASLGHVRLALGSLYPALRQLEKGRLVRSWTVVPGRSRGGRARRYYELTEAGVRASETARSALAALLAVERRRQPESLEEIAGRKRRLELGAELSETGLLLSQSQKRGSRRRAGAA
jgi:DNA-binding PadR family transcriptional regulator